MKPTSKEIKCLLISKGIREKRTKEVITEIENATEPYFVSPVRMFYIGSYKEEFFGLNIYKKILGYTVFHLAYLVVFIPRLFLVPYSNWEYRKIIPKIISDIWLKVDENFNVPEKKRFSILWKESGIYEMELWRKYNLIFTDEEALFCMKEWVKVLYNEDIDILALYHKTKKEISESIIKEGLKHPERRYSSIRTILQVPEEIDKLFGEYK